MYHESFIGFKKPVSIHGFEIDISPSKEELSFNLMDLIVDGINYDTNDTDRSGYVSRDYTTGTDNCEHNHSIHSNDNQIGSLNNQHEYKFMYGNPLGYDIIGYENTDLTDLLYEKCVHDIYISNVCNDCDMNYDNDFDPYIDIIRMYNGRYINGDGIIELEIFDDYF